MDRSRPMPLGVLTSVVLLAACASATASPAAERSESASASRSPASESPAPSESESATPSESASATAEEVTVRLESSRFDPSALTIGSGTAVVFENADGYAHTVTEGSGGQAADDPMVDRDVGADGEVRVAFDEAGTYEITCRFHPTMNMTITVEG